MPTHPADSEVCEVTAVAPTYSQGKSSKQQQKYGYGAKKQGRSSVPPAPVGQRYQDIAALPKEQRQEGKPGNAVYVEANRPVGRASYKAQEAGQQGKGAHDQDENVGPGIRHLAVLKGSYKWLYVR